MYQRLMSAVRYRTAGGNSRAVLTAVLCMQRTVLCGSGSSVVVGRWSLKSFLLESLKIFRICRHSNVC